MSPLLRIVDLHKSFGALDVLTGVSIDVEKGEKLSIIGPSGSGKTTLLRCINYLEKPTAGHIYVDDKLIGEKQTNGKFVHLSDRELAKERAEIGFVFQRFNLFPHLTALDNVSVAPRRVLGMGKRDAEEAALVPSKYPIRRRIPGKLANRRNLGVCAMSYNFGGQRTAAKKPNT